MTATEIELEKHEIMPRALICTSEGRFVNPVHVVSVDIKYHGGDVRAWAVELTVTDGTTLTRGLHSVRETAEDQFMTLMDLLGWRVV